MIRAKYLNSLRAELNRERAYVRSTKVNIDRGFNVSPMTKILASARWYNMGTIKKAIKALNNVRPVYQWIIKPK